MSEKETAQKLQEISELEEEIKSKIDRYNRLSVAADNNTRLALLIATSDKYDFDDDYFDDEEEREHLTHEEKVMDNGRPSPDIYRGGANAWFPSAFC